MPSRSTFIVSAGLFLIASFAAVSADVRVSRRDSDLLKNQIAAMSKRSEARLSRPERIVIPERQVNAYLTYEISDNLPTGVVEPAVTIHGTGRLTGHAVVDLDRVRKARNATSWLDPASYLRGRVPLTVTGVLTTSNGKGRFTFESADAGGVPVPKILLQEIVSYYARSSKHAADVRLDDPFALPLRIQEILVNRGEAIVIQQ